MKLSKVSSLVPVRVPYRDSYIIVNEAVADDRLKLHYSPDNGGALLVHTDGKLTQCISWRCVNQWLPWVEPAPVPQAPPPPTTQAALPFSKKKR